MTRGTFTIVSDASTVTLCMPDWGGENNSIAKDVRIFNFWDGNLDTVDSGITNQPLTLTGIECVDNNHEGLCIPYCVPFCFNLRLSDEVVKRLNTMMNDGKEVTISELGDCQNGVYIIKSFTWNTIPKSSCCYRWSLQLEFVRNI